jgi:hypothetical protein
MSKIYVKVDTNRLQMLGLDDEDYSRIVIEFIVGIKEKLAEYLAIKYNVDFKTALKIIKIHDLKTHYTIGIDEPELYLAQLKNIVKNILMYDLGSLSLKIKPVYIFKKACSELESNLSVIWMNYLARRKRGDGNIE